MPSAIRLLGRLVRAMRWCIRRTLSRSSASGDRPGDMPPIHRPDCARGCYLAGAEERDNSRNLLDGPVPLQRDAVGRVLECLFPPYLMLVSHLVEQSTRREPKLAGRRARRHGVDSNALLAVLDG